MIIESIAIATTVSAVLGMFWQPSFGSGSNSEPPRKPRRDCEVRVKIVYKNRKAPKISDSSREKITGYLKERDYQAAYTKLGNILENLSVDHAQLFREFMAHYAERVSDEIIILSSGVEDSQGEDLLDLANRIILERDK